MVTQDCRGFPQYLRAALLRRHQLASTPLYTPIAYNKLNACLSASH